MHEDDAARIGRGDVWFGVVCLLSVSLILPVQLATIVAFDSTGLDVVTPQLVFVSVVPALLLSVVPTLLAWRRYSVRAARLTATAVFLVCALAASYLSQFYWVCGGPGC